MLLLSVYKGVPLRTYLMFDDDFGVSTIFSYLLHIKVAIYLCLYNFLYSNSSVHNRASSHFNALFGKMQ
jgi:hypothetical protein